MPERNFRQCLPWVALMKASQRTSAEIDRLTHVQLHWLGRAEDNRTGGRRSGGASYANLSRVTVNTRHLPRGIIKGLKAYWSESRPETGCSKKLPGVLRRGLPQTNRARGHGEDPREDSPYHGAVGQSSGETSHEGRGPRSGRPNAPLRPTQRGCSALAASARQVVRAGRQNAVWRAAVFCRQCGNRLSELCLPPVAWTIRNEFATFL
jgi:hypothetical protein